jgi:hypothetical protein
MSSFAFQTYVPPAAADVQRMLPRDTQSVTLSTKPAFMNNVAAVVAAAPGLRSLVIPNLSFLGARDNDPAFTPTVETTPEFQTLKVNCSFQPRALAQLQALVRFISGARALKELECTLTEYPIDEFLRRDDAYLLPDDPAFNDGLRAQLVSLPGMPTPREREQLALEAEFQAWGAAFVEAVASRQLALPPPPLNTADQLFLGPAAVEEIQQQQLVVSDNIRSRAIQTMNRIEAKKDKPFHNYMTAREWESGIMLFLSRPLPPAIAALTLTMVFPQGPRIAHPIRVLDGLDHLETLSLPYCAITDAALDALIHPDLCLPRLRTLDLTRNSLTPGANLAALPQRLPALETLVLRQNTLMGGPAFTGLFEHLAGSTTAVLATVDLAYNDLETQGLRFAPLADWRAPNATLILPDIFSPAEVQRLEALMPDGSTLCLEGMGKSGFPQAAMLLSIE